MKCSLIVTTYNWKEALELVLLSVLQQIKMPDEVIIADDGSDMETRLLIEKYIKIFPIPLIHSWQEDSGFRLSHSRNKAISLSKYEYIIISDGDMILDKNFVRDHYSCAKKGKYVQGSRVLMLSTISKKILFEKKMMKLSFFSKDIKNRLNLLYIPLLKYYFCMQENQKLKRIRGCNFSLYKKDIIKVNGFNEDFITWGQEDSEFVQRLYNIGMVRSNLKFGAIQYHIYHKEGTNNNSNIKILQNTIDTKLIYCENGINKYFSQ